MRHECARRTFRSASATHRSYAPQPGGSRAFRLQPRCARSTRTRFAGLGTREGEVMTDQDQFSAFVFGRRGTLLALPALVLAACGKPSAFSVAIGLPLAFAGEVLRMWAVGYSGTTTRGDTVTAPALVTAGPYAYVRNPLYVGNVITGAGFALAFTGRNSAPVRLAL